MLIDLPKNTPVAISTTNGGYIVGVLLADYRATYNVTFLSNNRVIDIPGYRIKNVEVCA